MLGVQDPCIKLTTRRSITKHNGNVQSPSKSFIVWRSGEVGGEVTHVGTGVGRVAMRSDVAAGGGPALAGQHLVGAAHFLGRGGLGQTHIENVGHRAPGPLVTAVQERGLLILRQHATRRCPSQQPRQRHSDSEPSYSNSSSISSLAPLLRALTDDSNLWVGLLAVDRTASAPPGRSSSLPGHMQAIMWARICPLAQGYRKPWVVRFSCTYNACLFIHSLVRGTQARAHPLTQTSVAASQPTRSHPPNLCRRSIKTIAQVG